MRALFSKLTPASCLLLCLFACDSGETGEASPGGENSSGRSGRGGSSGKAGSAGSTAGGAGAGGAGAQAGSGSGAGGAAAGGAGAGGAGDAGSAGSAGGAGDAGSAGAAATAGAAGGPGGGGPGGAAGSSGSSGQTASGSGGAAGNAGGAQARLGDLWAGSAHFVLDQAPAAVPGAPGHREAFGVERPDRGANHQLLYHRCFNYPDGKLSIDICLDESEDGGVTFPISHGVIMPNSLGNFAVAPSVALVNGTWTMVWEEGGAPSGAYWATSNDGISWQKQGELLVGSAYNATPSLYTFQGTVYVFAAQFIEPQVLGIVFFSGPSMNSLTQYGNGFVLKGEQPWSKGGVSMPRVVYQEGVHYMIHEGSSVNFLCGATPAEPNTWGWGIARSTTLTEWESWSGNPVMQGEDGESCGRDMPQPLLRQDGSFFVYHTSDDVSSIERERLAPGSACTAEQLAAGWREKNRVCLPSCGGAMGNACYQTKDCPSGTKVPGGSYDCASCCQ